MIDLHCHSTASDGSLTPTEIVEMAATLKLTAIALTDHDTIDGLAEFMQAATRFPQLTCIPGLEFSCHLESMEHCHIVGLFIDPDNETLQKACGQYCTWREERNLQIIDKLNELGYKVTYDEIKAMKNDGNDIVGRPHIANALLDKGYFKNRKAVFDTLLGRSKPAYVARQVLDAKSCLDAIHAAGGLAIWAHPMTSNSMTYAKCEHRIEEMRRYGLDGIEAYYSEHTQSQITHIVAIAKRLGILVSGGSDFHGKNQPGLNMGTGHGNLQVPDELIEAMKQRL